MELSILMCKHEYYMKVKNMKVVVMGTSFRYCYLTSQDVLKHLLVVLVEGAILFASPQKSSLLSMKANRGSPRHFSSVGGHIPMDILHQNIRCLH
jgi:hypothetical protein